MIGDAVPLRDTASPGSSTIGEWLGLTDAVCVVTGAGNGIGAETARLLASVGAQVAVVDRDALAAARVAAQIRAEGHRALDVACDVAHPVAVQSCAERVRDVLGPCRVLVNNAAARHRAPLLHMDPHAWAQVLSVNATGAMLCAQVFSRQMIAAGQGGSLVHVGSILGRHPQNDASAYCVSKAALSMLSRCLSLELAEHRIRSNVISPGFVMTEAHAASYQDPAVREARERMIPSGRIGLPQDLGQVVLMLASQRSDYINGEDIVVDGGFLNTVVARVPRP